MSTPEPGAAIEPIVPRVAARDRVLPVLLTLSLVVHATIFLPSLLRGRHEAEPPREIPVEIVQLPPPPKPQPTKPPQPAKPEAKKPEPPKPPPKQVAQKPPPEKPAEKKSAEKPKPAQKSASERLKDLIGPMPAVALPGASADGTESVAYSQLVLSKVAKAKKEGAYKGIPGAASVSFRLGDAGEVASVEIVRASGDPSLDAEAIAMVRRGAPYPAPPPGGRRDYTITLRFQALI